METDDRRSGSRSRSSRSVSNTPVHSTEKSPRKKLMKRSKILEYIDKVGEDRIMQRGRDDLRQSKEAGEPDGGDGSSSSSSSSSSSRRSQSHSPRGDRRSESEDEGDEIQTEEDEDLSEGYPSEEPSDEDDDEDPSDPSDSSDSDPSEESDEDSSSSEREPRGNPQEPPIPKPEIHVKALIAESWIRELKGISEAVNDRCLNNVRRSVSANEWKRLIGTFDRLKKEIALDQLTLEGKEARLVREIAQKRESWRSWYDKYVERVENLSDILESIVGVLSDWMTLGSCGNGKLDKAQKTERENANVLLLTASVAFVNLHNKLTKVEIRNKRWARLNEGFLKPTLDRISQASALATKPQREGTRNDHNAKTLEQKKDSVRKEIVAAFEKERIISCASFVAVVETKLSDEYVVSDLVDYGSEYDLDKHQIETARKSISFLPSKLDVDMQQLLLHITNFKREVPYRDKKEPETFKEWLNWVLAAATLVSLQASIRSTMDAIYSTTPMTGRKSEVYVNFTMHLAAVEHEYRMMWMHPLAKIKRRKREPFTVALSDLQENDRRSLEVLRDHREFAEVFFKAIVTQRNMNEQLADSWIGELERVLLAQVTHLATKETRGSRYRKFYKALAKSHDELLFEEDKRNLHMWEYYKLGFITNVLGPAMWQVVSEPIRKDALHLKLKRLSLGTSATKAPAVHHLASDVVEDDEEDGTLLLEEAKVFNLTIGPNDATLAHLVGECTNAGMDEDAMIEKIELEVASMTIQPPPDANQTENKLMPCFCCAQQHSLKDCSIFKEKARIFTSMLEQMKRKHMSQLSPATNKIESDREERKFAMACMTALKSHLPDFFPTSKPFVRSRNTQYGNGQKRF